MSIRKMFQAAIGALGFEIKRKSSAFLASAEEVETVINTVAGFTMLPRDRLVSLYDQVVFCENKGIEGALVECGVWKGGSVALMAAASMRHSREPRQIHLFDSFQEICEPDAKFDGQRAIKETSRWSNGAEGRLVPLKGIYDAFGGPGTLEGNRMLLERVIGYPSECLHYHVGWFQDSIPLDAGKIGPIAILRLDGDWYESTKVCLDHLYDSVVKGGFVIVDDYGAYEGCRKAVDEFCGARGIQVYLHPIDAVCRYFIKP